MYTPLLSLELVGWSNILTAAEQKVAGLSPETGKKISTQISILKADVLPRIPTFLTNLLSVLLLPRNTTVNVFPFLLLPLPSYGENHVTRINTPILSYLSFLSNVHKAPVKGRKLLPVSSWYSSSPLFTTTLVLRSF